MDSQTLDPSCPLAARNRLPWAYLCVFLAAFLWGTSFVAGKLALEVADAPLIVLLRFVMASLFWLPLFCKVLRRRLVRDWTRMWLLSLLMIPATFLLQFIGLRYTGAASATLMIGAEPLMVMLVGWCLWREAVTRLQLMLGGLALIGVTLVMGWPQDASFLGCTLVLMSTLVVGVWLRWSKAWMNELSVSAFSAVTTVTGTLLLVPFTLWLTESWQVHYSAPGAAAIFYLGIGCSLAAGWLWNTGVKSLPANSAGLFLAMEPVFGVLFAVALLHEPLGATTLLGACLVVVPVAVIALMPLRRERCS